MSKRKHKAVEEVEAADVEASIDEADSPIEDPYDTAIYIRTDPDPMPETPTLETDNEVAAYDCGFRAGADDPGWLLDLAEVGRHLGSFLTSREDEAFEAMPAEEWWTRWALGYSDASAQTTRRTPRPPTLDEMDF